MDAQDGSQQQQFDSTNTAAVERLCERVFDRKMKEVKAKKQGGISVNIDVTLIAFYVIVGVLAYRVLFA